MSCCGDRRAQLVQGIRSRQSLPAVTPLDASGGGARASVRYQGPAPMVMRGPATGEIYRIEVENALVDVDAGDVPALIRTGWFARPV